VDQLVKGYTVAALIGAAVLGWYLLKPKAYAANVSNPIGTELLENKA